MKREALDGLGLNLLSYPDIVVHDLDDCRNPETGEISAEAMNIVRLVGGYWELTPSGSGIRGICRGQKPGPRVEASKGGPINGAQYDGSRGRYVTLTGHQLPESTPDICDAHPGGIEAAYALMFPAPMSKPDSAPAPAHVEFDDAELLAKARTAANGDKFNRLWSGDTTGYQSESEADEALCCLLAYWTGGDTARIERLFSRSGRYRDKWGREDYRIRTIQNALELVTEFYQPGNVITNGHHPGLNSSISSNSYPNNNRRWPDAPAPEENWPARSHLPDKPSAPRLPVDMIPAPYWQWVLDVSNQASFPPEMVAVPALVATSAVIGRKLGIRPWRFSAYTIPPNLWGAIVARPASMKSYGIDEGLKPVKRLSATAHDRFLAEIARDKARLFTLEAEVEGLKYQMQQATKKGGNMENLEGLLTAKLQELEGAQRRSDDIGWQIARQRN